MSYETNDLSGFDILAFAQKVQAGAEKLATNIERIGGKVATVQGKVNTVVNQVTKGAQTGAEVVRATTRAGIATAATGDSTSGLAAAAASTPSALKLGAMAAGVILLTRLTRGRGGDFKLWK